ncbi:hypothetical protein [Nocardioides houyundeii]|uniref:hypothetical protein n=1 Tax=Nocardioides houyundeii TaxID=2045452 RepID=UPI000C7661D3|nr:hypothetical protein [Nocardioides houyundeii]
MKTLRITGTLAIAGLTLAALPASPAMAEDEGTTAVTFALAGGSLTVDVDPAATLAAPDKEDGEPGTWLSGVGSVSGSLGEVLISDERGATGTWVVTAASSTFDDGNDAEDTNSTNVFYYPEDVKKTGRVDLAPTSVAAPGPSIMTGAPVVTGTNVVGNNTARFTPTLTVELPPHALADTYTGTVTTSVS